jgi:hypothetical protein
LTFGRRADKWPVYENRRLDDGERKQCRVNREERRGKKIPERAGKSKEMRLGPGHM